MNPEITNIYYPNKPKPTHLFHLRVTFLGLVIRIFYEGFLFLLREGLFFIEKFSSGFISTYE